LKEVMNVCPNKLKTSNKNNGVSSNFFMLEPSHNKKPEMGIIICFYDLRGTGFLFLTRRGVIS